MATTKDLNVGMRMAGIGGSISEGQFEQTWPHKWLRSGFSNPSWSDGKKVQWDLPKVLTAMPDYIARNGDGAYWVECVGCSGSKVTALKLGKLDYLSHWESFSGMRVVVFIYNSKYKRWAGVWLHDIRRMSAGKDVLEHSDGPEYYDWDWADLRELAYLEGPGQR